MTEFRSRGNQINNYEPNDFFNNVDRNHEDGNLLKSRNKFWSRLGKNKKQKSFSCINRRCSALGCILIVAIALSVAKPYVFQDKRIISFHLNNEQTILMTNGKKIKNQKGKYSDSIDYNFITIVMPSVVNPEGRAERLKTIAETWGVAARAFFVVHSENEFNPEKDNRDATTAMFPQRIVVPPDLAEKGVQRLKYVLSTIMNNSNSSAVGYNNFQYAFFVNDHTFVLPEHLCLFLKSNLNDENDFLYAGHAMQNQKETYAFNSGASGYILSKSTLSQLLENLNKSCIGDKIPKYIQGNPGLLLAKCLHESMNVRPIDTRDLYKRHRFHPYGIVRTVSGNFDAWFIDKHKSLANFFGKKEDDHKPLGYEKCCSPQTISFHYVEAKEAKALYNLRKYMLQQEPLSITDQWLDEHNHWPDKRKDTGFYSQLLPSIGQRTHIWNVLRQITKRLEEDEYCSLLQ